MPSTEIQTPVLSALEWEFVAELVHREARNLPIEIRHTDKRTAKEELHRRLEVCETLLAKLRPTREA
jgi:hypothetical protein